MNINTTNMSSRARKSRRGCILDKAFITDKYYKNLNFITYFNYKNKSYYATIYTKLGKNFIPQITKYSFSNSSTIETSFKQVVLKNIFYN